MLSLRIQSRKDGNEVKSIATGKYCRNQVFYNSGNPKNIPQDIKDLMDAHANYMLKNKIENSTMRVERD